jgi:integral membrane protein
MTTDRRFLRLLARLAVIEAASLVVLAGVMLAGPRAAVTLIGALHGAIWLLYAWLIMAMIYLRMWNKKEAARMVLCALLPLGGFATARWCRRRLLQDALRQHQ